MPHTGSVAIVPPGDRAIARNGALSISFVFYK